MPTPRSPARRRATPLAPGRHVIAWTVRDRTGRVRRMDMEILLGNGAIGGWPIAANRPLNRRRPPPATCGLLHRPLPADAAG